MIARRLFQKALSAGMAIALLGAFCFSILPAQAQAGANTLILSQVQTSDYPKLQVNFWPFDQEGKLFTKLSASDVHLMENEREVKIDSLELLQPGTHFVIAVNESRTLANSYSGSTRMERIKAIWLTWAKAQSITTLDDLSLVTNAGVTQNQLSKPSDWVQALNDYQPDLKGSQASPASFSQAINLLSSLPGTDQKSRAILYVTAMPTESDLATLKDQANLAVQARIRLFIWLVGPQSYSTEPGTAVLQQAAALTGGSFFLFSGAEDLPELSTYLEPYNYEYRLTYTTQIQASSENSLALTIANKEYNAESDKQAFSLTIGAPNPIFLSPPSAITLNWVRSADKKNWQLSPASLTLKYLVEFQDGHPRDLTAVRLFVDDKLVQEDLAAPFDELTWDVSQLTESGKHTLQLFVEDKVGLTAKTIEWPVQVTVTPKPQNAFEKLTEQIGLTNLIIIGFLLVAAVVMVFGLRRLLLKGPRSFKPRKKSDKDPLKQEVDIAESEYVMKASDNEPLGWPRLPGGGKAQARLVTIGSGTSIALPASDTLLGSDPKLSDVVLSGPTIASVHTQIFCDASKHFYIADKGSRAGTWLNYAPVSSHGTHLQHGDLVNIGALKFRFEVLNPEGRSIQVLPYQD